MRILFRVLGLSLISLLYIVMFMELIAYNVRLDELNTISSIAMSNTQILVQEVIEDKYYGTNTKRHTFMSDSEYIGNYIDNLNALINTNSKYEVEVIGVDYTKGLLDVEVNCRYQRLNGTYKVLKTRKTSIVDVLIENEV